MKYALTSLSLLTIVLFTSCNELTLEDPTLERVEDVDVKNMSKDLIAIEANLVINNPNIVALDLASADLNVLIDNIVIANIKQTVNATMLAKSEFKLPVKITMDLAKLSKENPITALSKGLQIISDRKLDLQFKGDIKAGKGIAKLTVAVDQVETAKF